MREIGAQLFGDLRRQAESVISGKINEELDEKIKCKFEWSMLEARGITRLVTLLPGKLVTAI